MDDIKQGDSKEYLQHLLSFPSKIGLYLYKQGEEFVCTM